MTAKVTLTLDSADVSGRLFERGIARIRPSFDRLPDVADQLLLENATARVSFACRGAPAVELYPNDLIGPQNGDGSPGWTYTISYEGTPGRPQPWSFYLLSTGGAGQRLSQLATAPAAQPGGIYLLVQGTPVPGAVPVIGSDGVARWSTAVILTPSGGS